MSIHCGTGASLPTGCRVWHRLTRIVLDAFPARIDRNSGFPSRSALARVNLSVLKPAGGWPCFYVEARPPPIPFTFAKGR